MGQSSLVGTPDRYSGEDLRRSTRLDRSVPLIIVGQNRMGEPFVERTVSVCLNLHGCRYPSRHDYGVGSWVTLQVVGLNVEPKPATVRARVRSVHPGQSARELQQVGVELETPMNIWGISSPPQDWQCTPSGKTLTAQFATAVAPVQEPTVSFERSELPPKSESKLAEVATFPSPSPVAMKPQPSKPPAPEPSSPQRVVVTPEGLLAALQGRLQKEAERAVQAAVAKQIDDAVREALSSIDHVRESSVREILELFPTQLEALRFSSKRDMADEIASLRKEEMETYRGRVDELAERFESQTDELRQELARSRDFVDRAVRDVEPQLQSRLNDAVSRAISDFEGTAGRAADRRYDRLLESTQAMIEEGLLKMDARSAEVQALLQSALTSALSSFERQTENVVNRALSETKDRAVSALSSLNAESRAVCDARRQALEADVASAAERSTEQFRKGMKAFLYSCLVAAVSAVDEHSKATLNTLLKDNGKNMYDSQRASETPDEPPILPGSDVDPITH